MPIIIRGIEQGSPEWQSIRLGIPTASNFGKILTATGKRSDQSAKYMAQLAAERITGRAEEGYKNGWMQAGTEREPESRAYYELATGQIIEEVTFCYGDEAKSWGCSPDGIIMSGEKIVGGLELKNRSPHVHIECLRDNKLPTTVIPQVQGEILAAGAEWFDYLSYYPGMKPFLTRVQRDPQWQTLMREALEEFIHGLNSLVEEIRA